MATESSIGSILAIDCGTVITKAVLLDQVNGAYRFLARGEALTTTDPPWQDIAIGVQHAIEQIEDASGRTLLNEGKHLITPQQSSGAGVDALVATCSAARPIRVALAGLVPEMSLSSARRAIAGTYSIAEEITGPNPSHSVPDEQQIRRLLDQKPDAICIVGGTDGGATMPVLEQVQIVTLACSMIDPANRPRLIFAGNKALRKQVVDLVAGQAEVRSVDNVRPTLEVENLDGVRAELDALYREQLLANLPGIELLDRWSSLPVTPAADAFAAWCSTSGTWTRRRAGRWASTWVQPTPPWQQSLAGNYTPPSAVTWAVYTAGDASCSNGASRPSPAGRPTHSLQSRRWECC